MIADEIHQGEFMTIRLSPLSATFFALLMASSVQTAYAAGSDTLKHRSATSIIDPPKAKTKSQSTASRVRPIAASGIGCMPETDQNCIPITELFEVFEMSVRLEGVEINGRSWNDGWTTVCRGDECSGFEIREAVNASGDENSFIEIKEAIIRYSEVRDKAQDACSSLAANGPSPETAALVRNTTSEIGSDLSAREAAATTAWNTSAERVQTMRDFASLSPSGWLEKYGYAADDGYTVTMTYADGGTEQYKFRIYSGNGDLQRVEGTLKPGSGVSRCPS